MIERKQVREIQRGRGDMKLYRGKRGGGGEVMINQLREGQRESNHDQQKLQNRASHDQIDHWNFIHHHIFLKFYSDILS